MKKIIALFLIQTLIVTAQTDEQMLKSIYNQALTNSKSYSWLDDLSNKIGSRLSGSVGAEKGVKYTKTELDKLGLDRVFLQEVMVPKWVRGEKEVAYIIDNSNKINIPICALGGSVATPKAGIKAKVIEIQNFSELEKLGEAQIKGKIVFYNRPMENAKIESFEAYGGAVNQRYEGAKEATKYGAVATIVRSMNLRLDNYPHTGSMGYFDLPEAKKIPSSAISTNGAELLSKSLKKNPNLEFYIKQSCQTMPDVLSYNVVGEIKGSEYPDRFIVVGGHLDSWDLADGSHDDGAGVVQSMDVLNILKNLKYKPKNTLRVVLFMNEENGEKGAIKYNELAQKNNENHIFALESDAGAFTPRGFSFDCSESQLNKIKGWKTLFEPYLIHVFKKGSVGVDVEFIQSKNIIKSELHPDSQRYFDYHHTAIDKFDAINKRELELGTATMTSLIYLIDRYGIE